MILDRTIFSCLFTAEFCQVQHFLDHHKIRPIEGQDKTISKNSYLMRRSCHNRSVEICAKSRNWLDCLFTFLFFAVSKKEGIAVEYFYCNSVTFSMS